jgi:hypothetical protein
VEIVGTASQIAIPPMQIIENVTLQQRTHGPPIARPNYISKDEDDEPQHTYNTRSQMTSIMQEAMLACMDITNPMFKISAAKLAALKIHMIRFCKMANSVLGKQGKLLNIPT